MQDNLIMELNRMLNPSDPFLKITLVQDMVRTAVRDDRVQVLRGQLKAKFHTLPKWTDERLSQPHPRKSGVG